MVSHVYIFTLYVRVCGVRAHTPHAVHFWQGTSVLLFYTLLLMSKGNPCSGALEGEGMNICFSAALLIVACCFWSTGGSDTAAVKDRRELPEGTRKSEDSREENTMV